MMVKNPLTDVGSAEGVWKYKQLLPVNDDSKTITLGEGKTKLHKCKTLAKVLGIEKIYAKDETRSPTGTHKDKPATVGVSKALEFGARTVAIASDRNAEPAGVASLAGVKRLIEKGIIGNEEKVVFEVTGTGLRDFESAIRMCEKPPCIEAKAGEIETVIESWEKK